MPTATDTNAIVAAHRRLINANTERRIVESAIERAAGKIAEAFARQS